MVWKKETVIKIDIGIKNSTTKLIVKILQNKIVFQEILFKILWSTISKNKNERDKNMN